MPDLRQRQLDFWTKFNKRIEGMDPQPFNTQMPAPRQWFVVAVGRANCNVAIEIIQTKHLLRVRLDIFDKDIFDNLFEHKAAVEDQFGASLQWNRNNNHQRAVISIEYPGLDLEDPGCYHSFMDQAVITTMRLKKAIKPFI